ncbi:MAG TPA: PepSY domain-containing protein [Thermoleophilaceae bacterium]|nr:PepSY domain-containing protein [Thermoleophilaceae bacterium]
MRDKLKGILIAVGAVAALGVGGAAIAGATSGGDDGNGKPITGSALDRASAIALEQAGGGKVTGTEVQDEEGYYEVEVTRPDGKQVDVHLDRSFHVLASKADHEDGK